MALKHKNVIGIFPDRQSIESAIEGTDDEIDCAALALKAEIFKIG